MFQNLSRTHLARIMPSKYEKERLKAKKEAAKQKGGKKASTAASEEANGNATNGSAGTSNGASKEATPAVDNGVPLTYEEELCRKLEEEARSVIIILIFCIKLNVCLLPRLAAEARACTGVLGIHPMARDIKIDNFSVTFYGANLLQDTKLELSTGSRSETKFKLPYKIGTFFII